MSIDEMSGTSGTTPGKTIFSDPGGTASDYNSKLLGAVDSSGNLVPGVTLFDVNGNALGVSGNPLVVTGGTGGGGGSSSGTSSDPALELSIGAQTDAVYTGTGTGFGSVIAILKGVYGKLSGTLSVQDSSVESALAGTLTVQDTAVENALGTVTDGTYLGASSGTVVSLLKGIYYKVNGTLGVTDSAVSTKLSGTLTVQDGPVEAVLGTVSDAVYTGSGNASTVSILKAIYSKLAVTQPVFDSTVSTKLSGTLTVQDSAVETALSGTLTVQDAAVENALGTVADTAWNGILSSASTISILKSLYTKLSGNLTVSDSTVSTKLSGTLTVQDSVLENTTGTITDSAYTGSGSSTIISGLKGLYSKLSGTLVVQDTAVEGALGTTADTVYSGSGNASVVSILKGLYSKLSSTLSVSDSAVVSKLSSTLSVSDSSVATALGGTLSVSDSTVSTKLSGTLNVSDSTVSSKLSGTLTVSDSAVSSGVGNIADGIYSGSGSASSVSILKGVYSKLSGTVPVSDSTVISKLSGTLTVSDTAVDAVAGTISDTVYTTGNGTLISLLKGVFGKLAGTLTVQDVAVGTALAGTLNVQDTVVESAVGTVANTAYTGTGNGTIIGVLKGLFGLLNKTLIVQDAAVESALGTSADSAYVSGNGSAISLLKSINSTLASTQASQDTAIVTALGGTLSVSDSTVATALAGTLTVQDVAVETALAGTLTVQDVAVENAVGLQSDLSYAGSGNGSVISLLKAVAANTVQSVSSPTTLIGGPIYTPSTVLVTSLDTTGYNSVTVQLTGTWFGGVQFFASNDGSNWYPTSTTTYDEDIVPSDIVTGEGIVLVPVSARYLQIVTTSSFKSDSSISGSGVYWNVRLLNSNGIPQASTAITADPAIPLPMGGVDPYGNLRRIATDKNGAIQLADADFAYTGSATFANCVLFTIDTRGFSSASVELYGTWAGTVSIQCSNTMSTWYSVAGYASTAVSTPFNSITNTGLYSFPTFGRYFRAIVTAYTSGTIQAVVYLRNEQSPNLLTTPAVNTAQIAGTAVVTGGVAGIQAVGGNVAAGISPTSYPILTGGIDNTGLTRRLLTDTNGALILAGIDLASGPHRLLTDVLGAPIVREASTGNITGEGNNDVLNRVLIELRELNFMLKQLPVYIAASLQNPNPYGLAIPDDESAFRNDPMINNQ